MLKTLVWQNMCCKPTIGGWQKEESAKRSLPWLTMQDYYTDVKQNLPMLLNFSAPL